MSKKMKITRDKKEIEKEFSQVALTAGDTHFKIYLERAKLEQLTVRMSELKKEYDASLQLEKDKQETTKESST